MRRVTVATVQIRARLSDIEGNLAQVSDLVAQVCNEQPVDLIVFPKLAAAGYDCGVRFTASLSAYLPTGE